MSDWKSRALAVKGTNDWKTRAAAITPDDAALAAMPASGPQPGMLESLLRGGEQGATLGFGDEINGALSALMDQMSGSKNDFSSDYTKERDDSRAKMKAAEAAHPVVSGIGNLAGGLGLGMATGGLGLAAEGAGGALAMGAGAGALSGLGNSEAKDADGLTKDALTGGVIGGALGGATGLVADKFGDEISQYGGKVLDKLKGGLSNITDASEPVATVKDALMQGLQGRKLYGSGADALNEEFNKAVTGAGDTIQDKLNQLSKAKIDKLSGAGDNVDIGQWVVDTLKSINKAKQGNPYADDIKDLNKVEGLVRDFVFGNEDLGIAGKGTKISAADAEGLMRRIGSMGSEGDSPLNTTVGKAFVNRAVSPLSRDANLTEQTFGMGDQYNPLKNIVNSSREGLDDINKQTSQLLKSKDLLPSISDVANLENSGKSGLGSAARVGDFFDSLPEDLRNQIQPQLEGVANARKIADKIAAPGLSHGLLADTARGVVYKGANLTGLASRALYDLAPEALTTTAAKIAQMGTEQAKQLSTVLAQAATKDQTGRNALLFAVQQNPAYREILRQATTTEAIPGVVK